MIFLVDTNVISELRKAHSGKADARVVGWARSVPPDSLYLSVITAMELETGVLLMERKDSKQASILRRWLDNKVMVEFKERILPIDAAVAKQCARLHVPTTRSYRDALIAATSIVHGMTVVSRNADDFASIPGILFKNPWL